ncbi:hypothetical protein [Brasilonema sp. UFV-L1]|uniref:hypothetical protein n=1 Tax=Brasilonema sp. UFV-L1 TaxID=2234130 RepID=UPI00145E4941|nr:hypothetical protein [Brasilonema sp. UFV-L1]NMG09113.1 hypothetical protein [Brasilonema sp. UFV-L1]
MESLSKFTQLIEEEFMKKNSASPDSEFSNMIEWGLGPQPIVDNALRGEPPVPLAPKGALRKR